MSELAQKYVKAISSQQEGREGRIVEVGVKLKMMNGGSL